MQRSGLPPPHPSLPRNPNGPQPPPQTAPSSSVAPIYPTYPQHSHYPAYYNSHYAQAYLQQPSSYGASPVSATAHTSQNTYGHMNNRKPPQYAMNSWYEPGDSRCSHPGCSFSGSHKSVELHMMDRHLIYPADWDKRKKQNGWDADPSLKGKPIPIQGTSIVLDSPEVLEAWIAERKRRFPTSSRVEEKKRKMSEAVARGQMDLTASSRAPKRRKMEPPNPKTTSKIAHPRRDLKNDSADSKGVDPGRGPSSSTQRTASNANPAASPASTNSSDDEDGEPEVVSSKVAPPPADTESEGAGKAEAVASPPTPAVHNEAKARNPRHQPLQPKLPPRNPFASRPTLLRNLLLPEVRITISNLSQAIRFLVDNDFLRDVELKPGQASEAKKIEIMQDRE